MNNEQRTALLYWGIGESGMRDCRGQVRAAYWLGRRRVTSHLERAAMLRREGNLYGARVAVQDARRSQPYVVPLPR